jgi:hypothetical protein
MRSTEFDTYLPSYTYEKGSKDYDLSYYQIKEIKELMK